MMNNVSKLVFRTTAFTSVLFASLSASAWAQDAPAAGAEKSLLDKWIIDGGYTMWPIMIAFAMVVYLLIYNAILFKRDKFCPDDLKNNLLQLMAECRVRSAIELGASSPTYLGRLVAYAIPNVDATRPDDLGRDAVEDAIADFTANESRHLFKWVNMLSLLAQVSPMLGLFGTVLGMVDAFAILSETGQADPVVLAGSISVALLTTLWGLINAIIAVPCFFFYKGIANGHVAECINIVQEMVNTSVNVVNAEALLERIPEGLAE